MKFCSYVLQSEKTGRYYIGSSGNIEQRLAEHNRGKTKSTRSGMPWKIVLTEAFETRTEAGQRERKIKSYKGGQAFKKLINK